MAHPSSARSSHSPRYIDNRHESEASDLMNEHVSSSASRTTAMPTTSPTSSPPTRSFLNIWQRIAGSPDLNTANDDDEEDDDDGQDRTGQSNESASSVPFQHRRSSSVPVINTIRHDEPREESTAASPPSSGGFLSSRFSIDPEPVMSRLRRVQQQRSTPNPSHQNNSSSAALSPSRLSGSWDRFRPRWPLSTSHQPPTSAVDEAVTRHREEAGHQSGEPSHSPGSSIEDPLDGDEGVVVDDEACFVDGYQDFLSSFPNEISLFILLHLDHVSLLNASAVSRSWRSLALDNLIWRDLFHQQKGWRIREPANETSSSSNTSSVYHDAPSRPASIRRTRTTAARKEASSSTTTRITALESPSRMTRRISDMVDTLGSLALSSPGPIPSRATPAASPRTEDDSLAASTSSDASWTHATLPTPTTPRRVPSVIPAASPSTSTIPTNAFATRSSRSRLPSFSREGSSSALASLASSIASLPPSLGPSRRTSSATLPPLGSIPSPSLGSTPSAPLCLNWPKLYRDRFILEQRWQQGKPKSTWFKGHTDSVYCLQFDSRKIISGSRDQTIRIWDISTGDVVKTLRAHSGSVLCLKYDDTNLITGSSDSTILIWNLAGDPALTGWEVARKLVGHSMGVLDLAFDAQWIVSCSKDTTIRVWHRSTGELYRVLAGHRGPVNAVELHGSRIISASGDATMKMWNVLTGETERIFTGHERGLACVTISQSGTLLASGSNDKTIRVWDVENGNCLAILTGHTDLVRSLAIDEVRGIILSGSYDRTTRVWDWKEKKEVAKYKQHTSLVFHVELNASKIVSSSHDQKMLSLDFGDGLDTSLFI